MKIKDNFDALSCSLREYITLGVDSCKLHVIEVLSLLGCDLLSLFAASFLLVLALLFVFVAVLVLLIPMVGLVPATFIVAFLLALAAVVVYVMRRELFADIMVRRLCSLFFIYDDEDTEENDEDDEE